MNFVKRIDFDVDDGADALIQVKSNKSARGRSKREIWSNVGRLCVALGDWRVERNDYVLILAESRLEVVECVLALMSIGAVAVPVNPLLSEADLEFIIATYPFSCCFVDDAVSAKKIARLKERTDRVVDISGRIADPGLWQYETLLGRSVGHFEPVDVDDGELALIVHSSGSEGVPKSILYSHAALNRFMDVHDWLFRQYFADETAPSESPLVATLPCYHLAGLCNCLQGLLMSKPTYFLQRFSPSAYLQAVHDVRCRLMILVPSMYRSLLKHELVRSGRMRFVRFCLTVGEPTPEELIDRIGEAFGGLVICAYAMTECQPGLTLTAADLFSGNLKKGSCGKHVFGEIKLIDRDGVERDDYGELWVRNGTTMHVRYGTEKLNRSKFSDGWFKTGDVFYRDEDGFFFHRGRVDDMFVSNGKNIFPSEIEAVLSRLPSVELACAAGIKDRGQQTVPAVLVKASTPLESRDVVEFCVKNGSAHLVPAFVKVVDELPLVGPNKINRTAGREILQAEYDRSVR